ncbi:uncharacterized protein BX664DRAFT_266732, partial [Halteromyces radiatus]|uniref:uncharacterized protein n=1 Tax=Halteromyces radiatus TaxID=101107 RepID=UPI0022208141
GHSYQQLDQLTKESTISSLTITALLHATPTPSFYTQLSAVVNQSSPPTVIWLVCSQQDQVILRQHTQAMTDQNKSEAWMAFALQTDTDYVWILDDIEHPAPGQHYLERLLKLSTTSAYRNTLLGTQALDRDTKQQQQCVETSDNDFLSRSVNTISGLWLLHRSWLTPHLFRHPTFSSAKNINRGFLFSQYLHSVGITPVALPLTLKDSSVWHHSSSPSCPTTVTLPSSSSSSSTTTTIGSSSVVFLIDHLEQLQELASLICHRRNNNNTMDDTRYVQKRHVLTLSTSSTLTTSMVENQLLQYDPSYPIYKSLASMTSLTVIGLPARDIQYVQWMMDLPMIALESWNKFQIQLTVITDRNPSGLTRLLRSITRAHYMGDKVDLTVIMDQSSDRVTQHLVNGFSWEAHGEKQIRHRIVKMNRMPVFVESWYPKDSYDDYCIILDDDLDVSDLFYIYAKQLLLRYRYGTTSSSSTTRLSDSVMGISLYTPRLIDSYEDGRRLFDPPSTITHPYLMQAVTNGGTLFFPEHWREFHDYLTARYADIKKKQLQTIHVPGARSGNWTNSWRRYMDEMMYLRGYVVLYPSMPQGNSFSTLYLDLKHHHPTVDTNENNDDDLYTMDESIRSLFQTPLVSATKHQSSSLSSLDWTHSLPSDVESLSLFDLWGTPVTSHSILLERGWLLQKSVSACPPSSYLVYDPADLLCPFARIVDIPVDEMTTSVLPTRIATLYLTNPTPSY